MTYDYFSKKNDKRLFGTFGTLSQPHLDSAVRREYQRRVEQIIEENFSDEENTTGPESRGSTGRDQHSTVKVTWSHAEYKAGRENEEVPLQHY